MIKGRLIIIVIRLYQKLIRTCSTPYEFLAVHTGLETNGSQLVSDY